MIPKLTFSKEEHLCGEIRIGKLYANGKAFIVYPFRIVYQKSDEYTEVPAKVLIGVPKKRFKHAVDRNRIKRLMREAYRHHKPEFVEVLASRNIQLNVAINYVGNSELEYKTIYAKMRIALQKITDKLD